MAHAHRGGIQARPPGRREAARRVAVAGGGVRAPPKARTFLSIHVGTEVDKISECLARVGPVPILVRTEHVAPQPTRVHEAPQLAAAEAP